MSPEVIPFAESERCQNNYMMARGSSGPLADAKRIYKDTLTRISSFYLCCSTHTFPGDLQKLMIPFFSVERNINGGTRPGNPERTRANTLSSQDFSLRMRQKALELLSQAAACLFAPQFGFGFCFLNKIISLKPWSESELKAL